MLPLGRAWHSCQVAVIRARATASSTRPSSRGRERAEVDDANPFLRDGASKKRPENFHLKREKPLPDLPERKTKWKVGNMATKPSSFVPPKVPAKNAGTPSQEDSPPPKDPHARTCVGCGATIQSTEPKKLGYIPPEKLHGPQVDTNLSLDMDMFKSILEYKPPPTLSNVKCQRCWKLEYYNSVVPVEVSAAELLNELKHIRNQKALILKIVDVFDFDGSFIDHFHRFAGGNPVVLLVNKIDLLPDDVSFVRIEKWIRTEARHRGLEPVAVHLVSAHSGLNLKKVAESIESLRGDRDLFIMGQSNVGKSSLVNRLWPLLNKQSVGKPAVTVSQVPGTTVATIGMPFPDGHVFYDTPGIMAEEGLTRVLSMEDYLRSQPKKRVTPRLQGVPVGSTLFIGGFARIDYLAGPPHVNLVVYASPEVKLTRVRTEEADLFYDRHSNGNLFDPIATSTQSPDAPKRILLEERSVRKYECTDGYNRASVDLVFAGLGWVAVAANGTVQLRSWYLPRCVVGDRSPLIPFDVIKKKDK